MYLRSKSAVELLALLRNVARYHIRRYMIMDLFGQRCFLTHKCLKARIMHFRALGHNVVHLFGPQKRRILLKREAL